MECFDQFQFSKDHSFKEEFLGKCLSFCGNSLNMDKLFCQPQISHYVGYKTAIPIE